MGRDFVDEKKRIVITGTTVLKFISLSGANNLFYSKKMLLFRFGQKCHNRKSNAPLCTTPPDKKIFQQKTS